MPDEFCQTPLMYAMATNRHVSIIEQLLAASADPNIATNEFLTPLHVAQSSNRASICAALCHYGADIFAKNPQGNSALVQAAYDNRIHCIQAIYCNAFLLNRIPPEVVKRTSHKIIITLLCLKKFFPQKDIHYQIISYLDKELALVLFPRILAGKTIPTFAAQAILQPVYDATCHRLMVNIEEAIKKEDELIHPFMATLDPDWGKELKKSITKRLEQCTQKYPLARPFYKTTFARMCIRASNGPKAIAIGAIGTLLTYLGLADIWNANSSMASGIYLCSGLMLLAHSAMDIIKNKNKYLEELKLPHSILLKNKEQRALFFK